MVTQTKSPCGSLAIRQDYEGTATITLNRPKNYNALSQDLMSELQAHFDDLKLDKTIFVIVIKGAGPGF